MQANNVNQILEHIPGYGSRRDLVLDGFKPVPQDEWLRMKVFVSLDQQDFDAMLATVEPLFQHGHEMVVGNYDYLLGNHDTAAILGWDRGVDEQHLIERRRFFTIWLARTLGIDMSPDFAYYLFQAGRKHAGHGERRIHVPEIYVTGAISLVHQTFSRILSQEMPTDSVVPHALTGWNKYLSMHLHMMLLGYHAAIELDRGEFHILLSFYGRIRKLVGRQELSIAVHTGETVGDIFRKLLNYYPEIREEIFEVEWTERERLDATNTPWLEVDKTYVLRPAGWRVHVNGRGIEFGEGFGQVLCPGDFLSIFPPTR